MKLRGLYAVTDDSLPPKEKFFEFIEAALKGGIDLLQLRLKKAPKSELIELARKTLELTKGYGIPLFINDKPEIAHLIGADGVHVGKDDPPVDETREKYGDSLLIGASAYGDLNLARKLEREGADYIAFGSFFPSPTKPEEKIVPLEVLQRAKETLEVPIFAIGGINHENALLVLKAGADGIAVVSAIFGYKNPDEVEKKTRELKTIVEGYWGSGD